jgi:hypothetical protein
MGCGSSAVVAPEPAEEPLEKRRREGSGSPDLPEGGDLAVRSRSVPAELSSLADEPGDPSGDAQGDAKDVKGRSERRLGFHKSGISTLEVGTSEKMDTDDADDAQQHASVRRLSDSDMVNLRRSSLRVDDFVVTVWREFDAALSEEKMTRSARDVEGRSVAGRCLVRGREAQVAQDFKIAHAFYDKAALALPVLKQCVTFKEVLEQTRVSASIQAPVAELHGIPLPLVATRLRELPSLTRMPLPSKAMRGAMPLSSPALLRPAET